MKRWVRVTILILLIFCVIFANFYAVRRIMHCGTKVYFYDKLLVAYDAAGMKGLKVELNKISLYDRNALEQKLVKDFGEKLAQLKDVGGYLQQRVDENKGKVRQTQQLRLSALVIIGLLILWRRFYARR